MEKVCLITAGILLIGNLFSQVPMEVVKDLRIINGDTTEQSLEFKNVCIHYTTTGHIKLFFNDTGWKDGRKQKFKIIKLENEVPGEESTYTLKNKDGEIVKLTHDFLAFTGTLYLDPDENGNFQRILVLN